MGIRKREEVHQLRVPVSQEDWGRGPADASVTLVEYGDYECPACQRAYGETERLLESEEGRVRFIFRHFPLMRIHQQALVSSYKVE